MDSPTSSHNYSGSLSLRCGRDNIQNLATVCMFLQRVSLDPVSTTLCQAAYPPFLFKMLYGYAISRGACGRRNGGGPNPKTSDLVWKDVVSSIAGRRRRRRPGGAR